VRLLKRKSRMFDCIDAIWNPLGGSCPHECVYCWARALIKRFNMKKYQGEIRLIAKELERKFKPDTCVFVQDMSDLFASEVPDEYILRILFWIKQFPKTTFLLLTKNPLRYLEFNIPRNCICGATIEGDRHFPKISKAPPPRDRIRGMILLKHPRKMVSVEPIMEFNSVFVDLLRAINPEFIYVGKDNYNNHLPTPFQGSIEWLIRELEKTIEVRRK